MTGLLDLVLVLDIGLQIKNLNALSLKTVGKGLYFLWILTATLSSPADITTGSARRSRMDRKCQRKHMVDTLNPQPA